MSQLIAIVGRPNVGKSTLFNRLAGGRKSIVEDRPGVTRDRIYARGTWNGRIFDYVDTGGFDPNPDDPLIETMRRQVEVALGDASAVFFLMDAVVGLTPVDEEIHRMLLRWQKPIFYIVNKCDSYQKEVNATEFFSLGEDRLFFISSAHGRNIPELLDALCSVLPEEVVEPLPSGLTHVAVVGRPNVGKSTLINRLLGEERLLTSDQPGTTRDSVDTLLTFEDGRSYVLVDTAGMRRKSTVKDSVEYYSVVRALKAIERAHVVLLVIDGVQGIADQDIRIASLVEDSGRSMILLINKWDVVDKDPKTADNMRKYVRQRYPFLTHIPIMFISGLSGKNVHKVMDQVDINKENWGKRIGTGELNRFVRDVISRTPPPVEHHRPARFFFVTQVATEPPVILFSVNNPDWVADVYRRFLMNRIRERYEFPGTPVRFIFRKRASRDPNAPKARDLTEMSADEAEVAAEVDVGVEEEGKFEV